MENLVVQPCRSIEQFFQLQVTRAKPSHLTWGVPGSHSQGELSLPPDQQQITVSTVCAQHTK